MRWVGAEWTLRDCLERVDALPPGQAKAARGGNAIKLFKL